MPTGVWSNEHTPFLYFKCPVRGGVKRSVEMQVGFMACNRTGDMVAELEKRIKDTKPRKKLPYGEKKRR